MGLSNALTTCLLPPLGPPTSENVACASLRNGLRGAMCVQGAPGGRRHGGLQQGRWVTARARQRPARAAPATTVCCRAGLPCLQLAVTSLERKWRACGSPSGWLEQQAGSLSSLLAGSACLPTVGRTNTGVDFAAGRRSRLLGAANGKVKMQCSSEERNAETIITHNRATQPCVGALAQRACKLAAWWVITHPPPPQTPPAGRWPATI